jgi:multidrug transporter EmrE-like cation transporter
MKHVIALVLALVLNASANLLMKVGAARLEAQGGPAREGLAGAIRAVLGSVPLLVGLTCFALNVVLYIYALRSSKLPISIAYPIMVGGGYALIAVVAHLHPALRESLSTGQKLGVALVLAGVFLIATQTSSAAAP